MSKTMIALLVTAALGIAGCATQREAPVATAKPAAPITKEAYDTAVRNAETQYKIDKDACASRSGNAKDICMAEASGREKVAKAEAEASYKGTPKAREDARIARAEATHDVAKQRCDERTGNAKDVCVKEADAVLAKAKADAKVDRVAADSSREADQAKRDADYKVAVEKCDALSGSAKSTCVNEAKLRYGKS
jgi:hypothetical protein